MATGVSDTILSLHYFLPCSCANGPGARAVVWTQGCDLGCPGCFNPETHDAAPHQRVCAVELAAQIQAQGDAIEGITISGGEPLQQWEPVVALLAGIKEGSNLSTLLFTGYSWTEVEAMPQSVELLKRLDVLIAGRYQQSKRQAHSLIGSSNKTVHFLTKRYTEADLSAVPAAELVIDLNGEIHATGIDPLEWET